jgi:hypothetical protein
VADARNATGTRMVTRCIARRRPANAAGRRGVLAVLPPNEVKL